MRRHLEYSDLTTSFEMSVRILQMACTHLKQEVSHWLPRDFPMRRHPEQRSHEETEQMELVLVEPQLNRLKPVDSESLMAMAASLPALGPLAEV
jgi:hypothetical protein